MNGFFSSLLKATEISGASFFTAIDAVSVCVAMKSQIRNECK